MKYCEYYLKNEQGHEFYAINQYNFAHYAKNKKGGEYYAKRREGFEYYIEDMFQIEHYAKNWKGDQYYAIDWMDKEYYARNELKDPYYAKDRFRNEFYAKNILDFSYVDMYVVVNDKPMYAKTYLGKEVYGKLNNDEFMLSENYAVDSSGEEYYPKNENGDEHYYIMHKEVFYVKDGEGNEKYARNFLNDEYYPHTGKLPRKKDESLFYAKSRDQKIIFPTKEDEEEYIYDDAGYACLNGVVRYAFNKAKSEKYPMLTMKRGNEIVLNNRYAVNENNVPMYPLDSCGNEYLQKVPVGLYNKRKYDVVYALGYPISHDGFIIVPGDSSSPDIDPILLPKIKKENIIRQLPQDSNLLFIGYLTNIKSNRKPRVLSGCLFKRNTKKSSHNFWMFLPFMMIIVILIILLIL